MKSGMAPFRILAATSFCLALVASPAWSTDERGDPRAVPTLARLSFQVPPDRMAEFSSAYESIAIPVLEKHGLRPSSQTTKANLADTFNRLFEVNTPGEVAEKAKSLAGDPAWKAVLQELTRKTGARDTIANILRTYMAPAGSGKTTLAGPGKTVPAGSGKGHWQTYDATDGLAGGWISAILQDREGYLWFGTKGGGVSRYDGTSFVTLTAQDGLAANDVVSIFQDSKGYLWFGTLGSGVSRYDGRSFTTYKTQEGLGSLTVWSIGEDRGGNLWLGTYKGVSRFDGQGFTTFTSRDGLAGNDVRAICRDREGNLWFGTNGGVSRYDGKSFSSFAMQDGLAGNEVRWIFLDQDGVLWFCGQGGVTKYDGKSFSRLSEKEGLGANSAHKGLQDRQGRFWFATPKGIRRYDPLARSDQAWTSPEGFAGLDIHIISTLYQDREGNYWIGAENLIRYDGGAMITYTAQDGLARDTVNPIYQDRAGNLWLGTPGGVSRYDGKAFTTFTAQDGLVAENIWSILQDRESNIWFGTYDKGVVRYDGKTFVTYSDEDGLVHNRVIAILQDRKGDFWFCTEKSGVSRYDGRTFTTFTALDGLAGSGAWSILEDREGNIWFGSMGQGVARYDGTKFTVYTQKDGLVGNNVISMAQDKDGNLWFGTSDRGASRYDGKTWRSFTPRDGLSGSVASIIQGKDGHIWFSGSSGVSRYDGAQFSALLTRDGLGSNRSGRLMQDREGNFWIGSTRGVTRFRPPAPSPPPIFLDAVVADRRYEKVTDLSFPSSVALTIFEFHGISFKTRPEAMSFRYRLKGYDRDWNSTHARRVEYRDLPRGTYTFEVRAVDRDLVPSEKPATVRVRVHLPYERISLLSALAISAALVGWQTARVIRRDRKLREAVAALSTANADLFGLNLELTEKTRALENANRQVQEATNRKSAFLASMSHELRTPMNAIIGFTRLVLRRGADQLSERHRENLQKVTQSADYLLNLINDILDLSKVEAGRVDIKPVRFDVRGLIVSCCGTVSPLVKPGVALIPEVAEDVGEAHTDEARLRQILINLLSNALKFTESGQVRVKCQVSSATQNQPLDTSHVAPRTHLVAAVSDTGVGIPANALGLIFEEFRQVEGEHQRQKGTGLGLAITKKLVELLGGTIGVESEVGKGSTFTVRIPFVYTERTNEEPQRGD